MSTTVREVRKEAARASYAPRLKVLYERELRSRLKDEQASGPRLLSAGVLDGIVLSGD